MIGRFVVVSIVLRKRFHFSSVGIFPFFKGYMLALVFIVHYLWGRK